MEALKRESPPGRTTESAIPARQEPRWRSSDSCGLRVVNRGDLPELRGLFVGIRFVGHGAASDFRPGQKFHRVGFPQRRMKFDVKRKSLVIAAVSRRLVNRHDVGHRLAPKIIVANGDFTQERSEVRKLGITQIGERWARALGQDKNLVRVAGEPRNAGQERFVLRDHARRSTFPGENILAQQSPGSREMPPTRFDMPCGQPINQISRVNLAMRVGIRSADQRTFVLKNQDMINLGSRTQFHIAFAPQAGDSQRLTFAEVGEGLAVFG